MNYRCTPWVTGRFFHVMCPPPVERPLLPVVGITGAVGTGKSSVATLFQRWGGMLISGDAIGKDVVVRSGALRRQLARAFGDDILDRSGIKRSLLAQRAFADADATARLNQIIHPHLLKELNTRIQKARRSAKHRIVVIDAALLAEWGPKQVYWDCLIGVWAPMVLRRQRLRQRGWTDDDIARRARRQMPWTKRRAMVDIVVKNDGDLTQLKRRARLCWEKILSSGCGGAH